MDASHEQPTAAEHLAIITLAYANPLQRWISIGRPSFRSFSGPLRSMAIISPATYTTPYHSGDILVAITLMVDITEPGHLRRRTLKRCTLFIQNYRRGQSHSIASITLSASEPTSEQVTHLDQPHDLDHPRFQMEYLLLPYTHSNLLLIHISNFSGLAKSKDLHRLPPNE